MSFWVWVVLVVGVVLAFALSLVVVGTPTRRLEARREKAAELRREAEERLASAGRREAIARQEEAKSRSERLAGEQAIQQADAIDPDLPDGSRDDRGRTTAA
jgi:flagellar biosynthesis/type III secretory pathway M-ring protein FliF/YscJ